MNALKELHLVSETDMGSGEYRYEWTTSDPHHHLVCRQCGASSPSIPAIWRTWRDLLLRDYGFRAEMNHLAIFGLCRECQQALADD